MTAPAHTSVIRRNEKELKLETFLLGRLNALPLHSSDAAATAACALLARSSSSPAVKAMRRALSATPLKIHSRVLFVEAAAPPPPEFTFCRSLEGHGVQLFEAHEFLVLDPACVWTGDSMRRDPLRSDAYEWYTEHDPWAAALARKFFERLWQKGARFH